MSAKTGKSRSTRAKPHDRDALYRGVNADSKTVEANVILDWDELYVHAIQKALVGRDNSALLKMRPPPCGLSYCTGEENA